MPIERREACNWPKYNNLLKGSAVVQWKSAWLETEGPRVRASPASLRCGPWARYINPSLVLVQPRKTRFCYTKILLMGRKESKQANEATWSSNSPGADFCTGLSFWLGTTYLPEKVWLQKCNPEVICNTPRYVVRSNCGSSFAVGRHLWTYPMLNEA